MANSHLVYHHSIHLPLFQGLILYIKEPCSVSLQSGDFSLIALPMVVLLHPVHLEVMSVKRRKESKIVMKYYFVEIIDLRSYRNPKSDRFYLSLLRLQDYTATHDCQVRGL